MSNRTAHRRLAATAVLAAAAMLPAAGPSALAAPGRSPAGGTAPDAVVRVDGHHRLQPIDGFGFASPFQRATLIRGDRGLSPANQRRVLDLLFSPAGVNASILRMGIGSSNPAPYDLMPTIEPVSPGSPDASPQYVWDHDDGGQLWLTQQAKAYGVTRFYFDAWSAPGFMKTNGDDRMGGNLCGSPGATACASGDWRQAYANYLVQFIRFYRQEGIRITDLGFTNEPQFVASYASMEFTPAQAVDFVKILGRTVRRSGLHVNLVCCDAANWNDAKGYSAAIEADPVADRLVRTQSGHVYGGPADGPLPTDNPHTWMSEWNPNGNTWNEAWDDGSGWAGITIAESIHNALAVANNSAYVYWTGASLGATRALIQVPAAGDGVAVSKRLWALAAYSRFIRPGAVRLAADASDPNLKVTAFRNANGSTVVELLNDGTTTLATSVAGTPGGRATTYLTDGANSLAVTAVSRSHGRVSVTLPARSLTTVVLD